MKFSIVLALTSASAALGGVIEARAPAVTGWSCTTFPAVSIIDTDAAINKLRANPGKMTTLKKRTESGYCQEIAWSNRAGIFACNDNRSATRSVSNQHVQELAWNLRSRCNSNNWGGQIFTIDNWNVIVRDRT